MTKFETKCHNCGCWDSHEFSNDQSHTIHEVVCTSCNIHYNVTFNLTIKVEAIPKPKALDAYGTVLSPGDKVICIEKSKIDPDRIDSTIGKIFTIEAINFNFPTPMIALDCHPFTDQSINTKYVASVPSRFVKIVD